MSGAGEPAPGQDDLELVATDPSARAYELRADGAVVASLSARDGGGAAWLARMAGGEWRFDREGLLRPRVVVTDAAGEEVASLRSRGLAGSHGTVRVGERELRYRTEGPLSDRWVLHDGDRPLITAARGREERYRVTCAEPSAGEGLLVVIACYGALQNSAGAAASAAI